MSISNKARFLLATTALVAALQAQGMDSEPATVPQSTRVAPMQPQTKTTGYLLALPDDLMLKIAQHLSLKDFVALSGVNKQIKRDLTPDLLKKAEPKAEHLVVQTNKTRDYGKFLETIKTENGRRIMETLVLGGKGLEVSTDTFTQHQDLLGPYVTSYIRSLNDPITPGDMLGKFPRLTNLNLCGNEIGGAGAGSIAEIFKVNKVLTTLGLWVNTILTTLGLWVDQIGTAGVISVAEALKVNTTLTSLNLIRNKIGDAGVISVAEALKVNTTLASLDLGGNEIGDAGAEAIADALKTNTTLTDLNLYANEIGDAGASRVAEALTVNTILTDLNLRYNQIGDAGVISIAEALKANTALTTLNLGKNRFGDVAAQALLDAIRGNENLPLKKLTLRENNISEDLKNQFRALARAREFKGEF